MMRRAIRDEQKEERRQQIVDVAWGLFQAQPYEAVNIVDVAQGAGIAKGTVFLYFSTKEELFMAVQEQQFAHWFATVDEQLAALPTPATIEQVVTLITTSLSERPGLTRLFAILHVILERNVSLAAATQFKQFLLDHIMHTGAMLESRLPFLTAGQGAQTLLHAYALVIGVQHLADPAPIVRQILDTTPELAVFDIPFAATFAAAFTALLKGVRGNS